jgi:hypothetical protein
MPDTYRRSRACPAFREPGGISRARLRVELLKIELSLGVTVSTAPQRVDQCLQVLLSSPLCSSQSAKIPARFHDQPPRFHNHPHPLLYKIAAGRNLAVMFIKTFAGFHFAFALQFQSGRDPIML